VHRQVLFQYEQSRAELVRDQLKIIVPVRVAGPTAEPLDHVLDAELDRVQDLLLDLLRSFGVQAAESWISDEDGEPVLELEPLRVVAGGPAVTLLACWTLESSQGFPQDVCWLTDWARAALSLRAGD
jgi:hypothetical protein